MRTKEDVWISRFSFIFTIAAIFSVTILEVAIALRLESMLGFTQLAQWAGAILWVALATASWVIRVRKIGDVPYWFILSFSILAICSIMNFQVDFFKPFFVWVNAIVYVLFSLVVISDLKKEWKNCMS